VNGGGDEFGAVSDDDNDDDISDSLFVCGPQQNDRFKTAII
jgi:hypothetical protein